MQRLWLGDALDFWKGAFLQVLRTTSPTSPVKVLPMFTDAGWTASEIETYASILDVPAAAMLSTAQLTNLTRRTYFSVCTGLTENVFVDPDTGVATGKPRPSHVTPAEIYAILTTDNIVAVYQHRPQRIAAGWLGRYAQLVAATGAVTVGYESAQVGMLFATRSGVREAAIRQLLTARLGAVAVARGPFPGRIV